MTRGIVATPTHMCPWCERPSNSHPNATPAERDKLKKYHKGKCKRFRPKGHLPGENHTNVFCASCGAWAGVPEW